MKFAKITVLKKEPRKEVRKPLELSGIMARESNLIKIVGKSNYEKLRSFKCLIVGAGGIGCELLKDCILMEFGEIHIVDLDTIDLSNLNRQFLFRQRDIKRPKSTVAVNAVQYFNNSKLVPYQGNVMDNAQFPLNWFKQFDIIFNGLDNLAARRYVNKMSQFLSTPLIESGTSGFDGYIQPIIPGKTECFDCTKKETQKTFPVCTIRSTPSQSIHCIAWAKNFLFGQLFTFDNDSENDNGNDWGTDDQAEIERIKQETGELSALKNIITAQDESRIEQILKKLFVDDIEKLLQIENLWKTRTKPVPLSILIIEKALHNNSGAHLNENSLWTIEEQVNKFIQSIKSLMLRLKKEKIDIEFHKDDKDTLEFVATAANIRSFIFNIPMKTLFDIKQIAGNIIPAIATTNAIIAGLSTLTSLRVLNLLCYAATKSATDLNMAFTAKASNLSQDRYISNPKLAPSNPYCPVSSRVNRGIIQITEMGLSTISLYQLTNLLREKYIFPEEVSILDTSDNRLLYDFDFDDLEGKKLTDLSLGEGSVLLFSDEEGDGTDLKFKKPIEFYFEIASGPLENEILLPQIESSYITARRSLHDETSEQDLREPQDKSKEDQTIILDEDEETAPENKRLKRPLPEESADEVTEEIRKKNKISEPPAEDNVIELD